MLMAAPAFAQDSPTFDESKDAKLVFTQTFEADWETWSTKPVDTIYQVEYYKNKQNKNSNTLKPWEAPQDWQKGIFRDTTIYLRNGVVVTDDKNEIWAEKDATAGTIIADAGTEKQARSQAMRGYGETDGGGDRYFKFVTDTAPQGTPGHSLSSNSYSGGNAARYRRNLFVRGLDIEDHSSYRLTFYVKAKARTGHDVNPYLVADVMRGYFHAEKPFSMGYINDSKNYKYTNSFEYTKDLFNGNWEKCTFMTYYIDDEVANNYVFVNGYWWAEDSAWYWAKGYKGNNTGMDLFYHVQPDKFFVRLGFSSDYTEFALDNMSLTKSYIGGVEYYQHMLRVDFGYQTNLKDLARAAYASTKIDAVEIPGEYFDVWGLKKDGTWEYTDIASAEYQGDGYMYLFADGYEKDGEFIHYTFDQYDKVLVSFYNPKEEDIQLKYTGSLFPKAEDIEWIKKGKLVENFYNEEAHLNPFAFEGVYSMYDRPPVMQKAQYEDGSFGLDGKITTLEFKFSREMAIDNPDNAETRQKCVVYVGEEIWDRTWRASDSTLVLTRPAKYQNKDLQGDFVVEINNLFIPNTQRKADDVAIHYNFGAINRDLSSVSFGAPVWESKFNDETVNPNDAGNATKPLSPNGVALWWNKESGWSRQRTFQAFDGKTEVNAGRLYRYTDSTLTYLRAFAVCPRNDKNVAAYAFLGYGDAFAINLTPGNYVLQYAAQPINKIFGFAVYVYPYVSDPRSVDESDKVLVAEHKKFEKYYSESLMKNATNNVDTILTTKFNDGIQIEKGGRYLIEVRVDPASDGDGGYPSMLFSNFELVKSPVSFGPILLLNEAVDAAKARVAKAADAKYAGEALSAVNTLIAKYEIGGTFTSTKPSDWQAAAKETDKANDALKLRMDTVDLVVAKADEVAKKIASAAAENANWAQLLDYEALTRLKSVYDAYVYSSKTNAELTAFTKDMDDAIKALDARIADTKQFNVAMKAAKALIDAKEQESFTEYGDLKDAYEDKEGFDTILTTDDQLTAALNEIVELTDAYRLSVGIFKVGTRRIKELDKLAKDLGSTIADTTVVKDLFDNLKSDDDYLAAIYKSAIKAAIYEKGAAAGELDLTAFVKNYYLYATPSFIEMLDKNQTDNRNDFNYDADKHGKASVVHTNHKWNKVEIWMTMTNADFVDLMPGWTFKSVNDGNGNDMVYVDSLSKNSNLKEGVAVFDGAVSMDWGSNAVLTQTVLGLPAGEYNLGIDIRSDYSYENKGKGTSAGSLTALSASDTATVSITTDYLDPATYTLQKIDSLPGQFDTIAIENSHHCDSTVFVSVDVKVGDGENMAITLDLRTNNGAAQADNFKLTFKPSATFDYAAAAAEAKAKVAEVITLVDFNKAQKANVEFYTLGGLKVDGAKAGQILIRKTTGANGKVAFDKVLLK
jgi:hypothetical protein